jgi:protein-L-isoaspartate(D-aspartate) O-methyltransferase
VSNQNELVTALNDAGQLPENWAAAFSAVDRAGFIPDQVWFNDPGSGPQPVGRTTDPDRWRHLVYRDAPITTQLDDGATVWPDRSNYITSSSSQPSVMLAMLDALDVHDGHRVLEIGTGTGYNTALLAQRLGDEQVTTVEVDADLTAHAGQALRAAGYKPTVMCGDGAAGYPEHAPYDRIICTAAVTAGHIPYAWITQARSDGVIVTPWGTAYSNGAFVRLTVHPDGTATGRVAGNAAFMRLRQQRVPFGYASRLGDVLDASTTAVESTTSMSPEEVVIDNDGEFSVGLRLVDVQVSVSYDSRDDYEVLLFHVPTGSVATVLVTPEHTAAGRWPVRQHGPRRLWDEAEAAYSAWVEHGKPARDRYGMTVTADRQVVWLDQPANVLVTLG